MLRKFKVSNFKCFDSNFELDLTKVNAYEFNKNCIKENIVKTGLIYGYNGCGKSNLALALFDIIEHLTDKNRNPSSYKNYLCANSSEKHASFYYEFYFNSKIVVYEYKKTDYQTILYERLSIDGEDFVIFDRKNSETAIVKFDGTETLNTTITNNELSVLKYIKSNAQLNNNEINDTFHKLMQFIDSMLFFRSLEDRTYLGFCTGSKNITDEII